MSEFYRKDNYETTIELYNKKRIYDNVSRDNSPNLVNFQFAEKALYGRVDRKYLPMVLKNSGPLQLSGFGASGTPAQTARALNFVTDAFEDLRNQFMKKTLTNEISPNEDFLSDPFAFKGYVSPEQLYNEYIDIYLEAFQDVARSKNLLFSDFREFLAAIKPFLMKTIREKPFTYTAFVKSRHCPINVSGLVIEIAELDHVKDVEKIESFVQSPNWDFYLTACGNFGFMVDRNTPWRLVADIASPAMLAYAEPYGILSTEGVIYGGFRKAHETAIHTLRNVLYRMYMKLKKPRYSRFAEITSEGTKVIRVTPKTYTPEEYSADFPDSYFLDLYCDMRFVEEELKFTEAERYQLKDNTLEIAQNNFHNAVETFETIINKTFDYNGSLSYIKDKLSELKK
mgnify:CR=1 FL=1